MAGCAVVDIRNLQIGIFRELQDLTLFNSVKPFLGSIQWKNGQDFCPDTLYLDSVPVPHTDKGRTISARQACYPRPVHGTPQERNSCLI